MTYFFALIEADDLKATEQDAQNIKAAMLNLQNAVKGFGTVSFHGTSKESFKAFQAKIKELGG